MKSTDLDFISFGFVETQADLVMNINDKQRKEQIATLNEHDFLFLIKS